MTSALEKTSRPAVVSIIRSMWMRNTGTMALTLLGVTGCFLGYDSRWGQQKRAQQNFARQEAPSKLRRGTPSEQAAPSRTARVRVYATRAYSAEVLDWPRRFTVVIDDANAVIGPILDARLEVVDARAWPVERDDEKVDRLVTKLREQDSGDGVEWVIGLAGSMPRFESSFHELGIGELVGKHIVLRAITNAAEYQAIEQGLSQLSERERDDFRRARLAHKVATVLLHELGHTLGALHEKNPKSIMNPAYSRETTAYSPEAIELMRLVFSHRTQKGTIEPSARPPLVELLRREPNPWVTVERDEALRRFDPKPPMGTSAPASASPLPPPPELASLSVAEQRAFADARSAKDAHDFVRARQLAAPLFDAYPANAAIQELRCQIASQRGLAWNEIESECRAFMKLQKSPRPSP